MALLVARLGYSTLLYELELLDVAIRRFFNSISDNRNQNRNQWPTWIFVSVVIFWHTAVHQETGLPR